MVAIGRDATAEVTFLHLLLLLLVLANSHQLLTPSDALKSKWLHHWRVPTGHATLKRTLRPVVIALELLLLRLGWVKWTAWALLSAPTVFLCSTLNPYLFLSLCLLAWSSLASSLRWLLPFVLLKGILDLLLQGHIVGITDATSHGGSYTKDALVCGALTTSYHSWGSYTLEIVVLLHKKSGR